MHSNPPSCIILAGGQGQRMNHVDKGLISFHGKPLIAHVLAGLKHQVDDIVISANRNIDQYRLYTDTVISDQPEMHGPLSGIAAALPACQHDEVLVAPCDMPFLPADLVTRLQPEFMHHQISIAEVNQRLQLVFLMRKPLLASVGRALDSGNYSLMHWVTSCSMVSVDFSDCAQAFTNINTLDDIHSG